MSLEPFDLQQVIDQLEQRRAAYNAAIDAAIANLRIVNQFSTPNGPGAGPVAMGSAPDENGLEARVFFGLSIGDAAKKYLSIVRSPQTNKEIAEGLEKAGYHHTSKNFANTIGTALWRVENTEGDVFREGRNWMLSEWYPGRRRKKTTDAEGPTEADLQELEETEKR